VLLCACGAKGDPQETARRGCKARYDNIQRWVIRYGREPTAEELAAAAVRTEKDPWGRAYVMESYHGQILVWSPGPDGKPDNADDISYPPGR